MKTILSFLTLLLLTASCQSDDSYTGVEPKITYTEDTPREQVINFDDTESAHDISFKTNYTWRVDVCDRTNRNAENNTDWLHVSQYGGGRGSYNLKLTTKVNETGQDRRADIIITCGDKTTFTLIQKRRDDVK